MKATDMALQRLHNVSWTMTGAVIVLPCISILLVSMHAAKDVRLISNQGQGRTTRGRELVKRLLGGCPEEGQC